MINLLRKSGMSDGDERSYPVSSTRKTITWSLSFSVDFVLKRQDSRYMCVRSASGSNPGTAQICITSVQTTALEYLKEIIPRYVGTDVIPGLTGSSEQLQQCDPSAVFPSIFCWALRKAGASLPALLGPVWTPSAGPPPIHLPAAGQDRELGSGAVEGQQLLAWRVGTQHRMWFGAQVQSPQLPGSDNLESPSSSRTSKEVES